MQEKLSEILFYIKGTLKYKWVIVLVAWLVSSAGWVFVITMPDIYESEAQVNVDSRTMLRPLLHGIAVESSTRGLIGIMGQLMFTRPNLEKVAKLAGLDFDSKNEAEKQALIEELKSNVKISGGNSDLFTIAYGAENARKAQDIVHSVLTVFSQQTQQRGIGDTGSAQQFIEEQIREYEARLRNAEKARENFNRINAGLLPTESGGQLSRLNAIREQLQAANMALSEANSRWRVLKRQMNEVAETDEDEWGLADAGQNQTAEDVDIAALKAKMNNLLLRYTENHPDILSIKTLIADLQKSKQERLASMPRVGGLSSGAIANPYVQALKTSLNQIESERASIQSRINVLNKRSEDIKKSMDARLRIETELQNLDRDYSVIKSNYMALIERREKASISDKMSASQGVLRFTVVEAPSQPLTPSAPNRMLLNSGVLLGGIAVGFAVAFLMYFINPTFMSTQQIRAVTGLPVLGSVAMHIKENEKSDKGRSILFWCVSTGLLCAYLFAMIFASHNEGIRAQIVKMISL